MPHTAVLPKQGHGSKRREVCCAAGTELWRAVHTHSSKSQSILGSPVPFTYWGIAHNIAHESDGHREHKAVCKRGSCVSTYLQGIGSCNVMHMDKAHHCRVLQQHGQHPLGKVLLRVKRT